MEVRGDGRVAFDRLYLNNNMHHIEGRCIQPAIGGGVILACSYREDGGGKDETLVTRLTKDQDGDWELAGPPYYTIIPVGETGYASWIRQFGAGYLLAGSAYKDTVTKFDIFLQYINEDRTLEWTQFYGMDEMDEFADAVVVGDHVYLAGAVEDSIPGTSYHQYQIYVSKLDATGGVVWENTYGGATRHFANSLMLTEDGNLMVAGTGYDQSMHTHMLLLKIDAETGDSLWMQTYGADEYMYAGIRDAVSTSNHGYMATGRASIYGAQDPHVYVMSLNYHGRMAILLERRDLNLEIVPGTPTTDVIDVTADKNVLYGVNVTIDSLLHPNVGDLQITLEHGGTTVTLVDQPANSGENLIHTGLQDGAEMSIDWSFAPYSGWFFPEEPLAPFKQQSPDGEWTLTVTDLGSGGVKNTSMLVDWNLNLIVESGGTGIPTQEEFANFGLEKIRPNPVKQDAIVSFRLPKPGHATLRVFNQLGQVVGKVADEHLGEGVHERLWNTTGLAPGTYFIQLESGGMLSVRKALVTR